MKCNACGNTIEDLEDAEFTLVGATHRVCPGSGEAEALAAVVEWKRAREALKVAARRPKKGRLAGETDAARTRLVTAERELEAIADRAV